MSKLPRIIAHRGASLIAPENTLIAFQEAKKRGASWIECDVLLTSDKVPVILHDRNLKRTTGFECNIDETDSNTVKTLEAGNWFNPRFKGEKIPTLEETLCLCHELSLGLMLEVKCDVPELASSTFDKVFEILKQNHYEKLSLLMSSFYYPILERISEEYPQIALGFAMHEWENDWREKADKINAATIHANQETLTHEKVEELKTSQKHLLVYTVNEKARAKELFSWGINGIFTDNPELY